MEFYVLVNPKAGAGTAVTEFIPGEKATTIDAPRCSRCGRYIGMRSLVPPIRAELETWGTQFGDVAFGPGDEVLMSDRFLNMFHHARLSGLMEIGAVQITRIVPRVQPSCPAPTYVCCRVTRSRAAIDDIASGVIRNPGSFCDECRMNGIKRVRRIVIEHSTWSGEDIFIARGLPGAIIASQRFRDVCVSHSLLNCRLVPAEEYSLDFYPFEKDE